MSVRSADAVGPLPLPCSWSAVGDGLRTVVRPGSDTGTPLLMCSGFGARLEVFDPLLDALDPSFSVVRVDMPQVGPSSATALPLGMPQLAGLLVAVLDRLGLDRVDVLGHSWGGALVQQFAFQHPDRCRRVVRVATSTGAVSVPGNPGALLNLIRWASDPAVPGMSGTPGYWGRLLQLAALVGWTSLPVLPLIHAPALVVSGTDDRLVPAANARILAALLPDARLYLHPGVTPCRSACA